MAHIRVENLSVEFPLPEVNRKLLGGLKKAVGGAIRFSGNGAAHPFVSALEGVNLDIKDGDRIGLLGHNGAGKSTLLKTIAGVYPPSKGTVHTDGKMASIFRSGLGLEPELSGYDNIHLAALLQGHTKREIASRVDEIVEFAELGDYMHLPVRTYSAGMRTRLTFAVATSTHPEILILDEGVNAGDENFAKKARLRIQSMVDKVQILLIASHSTALLERFCNKGLFLNEGKVQAFGAFADVKKEYADDA